MRCHSKLLPTSLYTVIIPAVVFHKTSIYCDDADDHNDSNDDGDNDDGELAVATNHNRSYCVIDPCRKHVAAWDPASELTYGRMFVESLWPHGKLVARTSPP